MPYATGSEVLLALTRAAAGADGAGATPVSPPTEPYSISLKRGGAARGGALKTNDWEERAAAAASAAAALKADVHVKTAQ